LPVSPAFCFSWDSLDWGTRESALPAAGVAASKSTDGVLTWNEPTLTGVPADGAKITSDPNMGVIYVAGSSALGPISTGDPNAHSTRIATAGWFPQKTA
jgi:hypothetical protein